jgi:hypothetical protein
MPDEKLTPATRHDVEICLSLALTSRRALARSQAAETMSKVVAERLVAELEASGFVIMRGRSRTTAPETILACEASRASPRIGAGDWRGSLPYRAAWVGMGLAAGATGRAVRRRGFDPAPAKCVAPAFEPPTRGGYSGDWLAPDLYPSAWATVSSHQRDQLPTTPDHTGYD